MSQENRHPLRDWTLQDSIGLREHLEAGKSLPEAAKLMDRSPELLLQKADELGLVLHLPWFEGPSSGAEAAKDEALKAAEISSAPLTPATDVAPDKDSND